MSSGDFGKISAKFNYIYFVGYGCRWLASRCVNTNSDNCNFNVGVYEGTAGPEGNNLFNSDGNENLNSYAVRPVASINCGYASNTCIRDNIETNHYPFTYDYVINKK